MRHRGVALGALAASVFGVSLEAVGPLLTRVAVDDAVAGSTAVLGAVVTAILVLALVRFGASFLRRYLAGRLALNVQHDLRRQVFAAVQRLDGQRQDALRTGQVVSRAITDLQLLQMLLSIVPLSLGVVVLVVASVAAMLWLSPLLTVVALVLLPAAGWITLRARAALFPATWSAQQRADVRLLAPRSCSTPAGSSSRAPTPSCWRRAAGTPPSGGRASWSRPPELGNRHTERAWQRQRLRKLDENTGNRLEKLRGNRADTYSIRVNRQWRICFRWTAAGPEDVEIVEYH